MDRKGLSAKVAFEQRTSRRESSRNRKIRRTDMRSNAKVLRQGQAQHIWETKEARKK